VPAQLRYAAAVYAACYSPAVGTKIACMYVIVKASVKQKQVTISRIGPDVERAVEQALAEHGLTVERVEATKSNKMFWGLTTRSLKARGYL